MEITKSTSQTNAQRVGACACVTNQCVYVCSDSISLKRTDRDGEHGDTANGQKAGRLSLSLSVWLPLPLTPNRAAHNQRKHITHKRSDRGAIGVRPYSPSNSEERRTNPDSNNADTPSTTDRENMCVFAYC